jgi:predicted RNA-binding protein associated with RNAse of E/G family
MKRAFWVIARVTIAAISSLDSLFCAVAAEGEDEATQVEIDEIVKEVSEGVTEHQVENAMALLRAVLEEKQRVPLQIVAPEETSNEN